MGAAAKITILRDGRKVSDEVLDHEALIGRSEECAVRLDDRAVSREHALIRPVESGFQIERKSEFGPIQVNGEDCTSVLLHEGDMVSIGPYLLKISLQELEAESAISEGSVTRLLPESLPELEGGDGLPDPMIQLDESDPPAEGADPVSEFESSPAAEPSFLLDSGPGPGEVAEGVQAEAEQGENAGAESIEMEGGEPEADAMAFDSAPPEGEDQGAADLGFGDLNGGLDSPFGEAMPQGMEGGVEPSAMIADDAATRILSTDHLDAKLVVLAGEANAVEIPIGNDEISIGRGKTCDLVLEDKKSSRKHAVIRRDGARFILQDLGSSNGTLLNGNPVRESELSSDDVIRIGRTEIQFQAVNPDYSNQEVNFLEVPEQEAEGPAELEVPDFGAGMEGFDSAQGAETGFEGVPAPQSSATGLPPAGTYGGFAGVPGLGGVAGMGTQSLDVGKRSLVDRWKAMPPLKRIIYILGIGAVIWMLVDELDTPAPAPKTDQAATGASGSLVRTFASLAPEQKRFVENQYNLAFDHFRNQEYDNAIFEMEKVFQYVDEYKDARQIERYAKEGKRKMEALKEERRRREEEERIKAKVDELVAEAGGLMEKKQYEGAGRIFSEILALDPENPQVAKWQREIDSWKEQKRLEAQERQIQAQINEEAWNIYKDGISQRKKGKYLDAIRTFKKVPDTGTNDKRLLAKSSARIEEIESKLKAELGPLLEEAKQKEDGGELSEAYKLYEKATQVDPRDRGGFDGMARIAGILHNQAKMIYTEAVIAESYSDFQTAKQKFEECLRIAPKGDIYYERSKRKLSRYISLPDETPEF